MGSRLTLEEHLKWSGVGERIGRIILVLADASTQIQKQILPSYMRSAAAINPSGDKQTALDVTADRIIIESLKDAKISVSQYASEEQEGVLTISPEGLYAVAADPCDGSKQQDISFPFGPIFTIFNTPISQNGKVFNGKTGRQSIVAAFYVLYGSTTALVYTAGNGTHQFLLDDNGFKLVRNAIRMNYSGNVNSPGASQLEWLEPHSKFIQALEKEGYRVSYSGALVSEMHRILIKGGGVFSYPSLFNHNSGKPKSDKLRVLYELFPMSFIFEQSSGRGSNGFTNLLDLVLSTLHQKSPAYLGSRKEVNMAEAYLGKHK